MTLPSPNNLDPYGQQLANLQSQLAKTQMLQDKYDEVLRELNRTETKSIVSDGNAYLLSVMGKWQANPASAT